jgi:hypothetical protein
VDGLSRGPLITSGFVGSFDEFSILELVAGSDEGDEVWCVDRASAMLG